MINSALAPPSKKPPLIRARAARGFRAVAPAAAAAAGAATAPAPPAAAAAAGAATGKNQGLAEAETRQTHRVKAYRA